MRKLLISIVISLLVLLALTDCTASRKNQSELKGLMLQDNLQMGRNKAFYSKHNLKTKREAFRRYKRNNRYL